MRYRSRFRPPLVGLAILVAFLAGCGEKTPLAPANRRPVVQSLTVFPTVLAPGDSAIVTCEATDPDGDRLYFDWSSGCRLKMKGDDHSFGEIYSQGHSLVVFVGTCAQAPADTGLIWCHVRDGKGGGASAGYVQIIIRQ